MVQIAAAPSSERVLEKKRRILEAASRVFRRQGLHATGMREIAAELDMHVGNLYYYFDNKQALLAFCQQDTLGGLLRLANEVVTSDRAPDAKLYVLAVGHLLCLHEGTPGSLAHLEVEALEEPWRADVTSQRRRYEGAVRQILQEGIAAGVFRSVDVGVAASAFLGALNWTVKWLDPKRGLHSAAAEIAEIQVRGVLAPGKTFTPPGD